jgi:hypothetical protein
MNHREQLSVPLSAELRAFVQNEARREDRSEASVVRRLIAEAAARRERSARATARDEAREAAA